MVAGNSMLKKVTVSCYMAVPQKVYAGWYFIQFLAAIQTTTEK